MELRHEFDLAILLLCAQMARSSYYYYIKQLSVDKYAEVKSLITRIYHKHKGRLGYRRITILLNKSGMHINHKTVLRLMRILNLKSLIRIKKYKSYKGEHGKIAPNILNRNFKALGPQQKWTTDVTEFNVQGKKLYLSPVLDLFNQEIISYKISERADFKSVMSMVQSAVKKIKSRGEIILHSDQGWQYQMVAYQNELIKNNVTQSMSRKGNCLDNAVMENFFGTLKSELFYLKKYSSINELKTEITQYIKYYNHERIKLNLNGMSPIQYRAHYNRN